MKKFNLRGEVDNWDAGGSARMQFMELMEGEEEDVREYCKNKYFLVEPNRKFELVEWHFPVFPITHVTKENARIRRYKIKKKFLILGAIDNWDLGGSYRMQGMEIMDGEEEDVLEYCRNKYFLVEPKRKFEIKEWHPPVFPITQVTKENKSIRWYTK